MQRRTGRAAGLLGQRWATRGFGVRVEALQLLGTVADRSVAALLLSSVPKRNSDERPIALDGYLPSRGHFARGRCGAALKMLHRVLAMRAPASVIAVRCAAWR
ncbi:MAG: hypothetical protein U1E76_16615 [Planctomycetota bacterium]